MLHFELIEEGKKHFPHVDYLVENLKHFANESHEWSLREQLNACYQHGGGWQPFEGFAMLDGGALEYPGDPVMKPLATAKFRNQIIHVYNYGWVAIVEENGSFEVCRMD